MTQSATKPDPKAIAKRELDSVRAMAKQTDRLRVSLANQKWGWKQLLSTKKPPRKAG